MTSRTAPSPPRCRRDVMRRAPDFVHRVRHGDRQPDAPQRGQVHQLIAHERDFLVGKPVLVFDGFDHLHFVDGFCNTILTPKSAAR